MEEMPFAFRTERGPDFFGLHITLPTFRSPNGSGNLFKELVIVEDVTLSGNLFKGYVLNITLKEAKKEGFDWGQATTELAKKILSVAPSAVIYDLDVNKNYRLSTEGSFEIVPSGSK